MINKNAFCPTICLTYNCNLQCVYCYQHHKKDQRLTYEKATEIVDDIFAHIPQGRDGVSISFIGGEPLLEFDLIRRIVEYTDKKYSNQVTYEASTNGTVLTENMKQWFVANRKRFFLGLSLDGTPEVHNHNRSNSYEKIDFDFFLNNYPKAGVKMTLSEFSLPRLAESIKHIHSLGFHTINGVNLFEGTFDWSDEKYIKVLIPQLEELDRFYTENPQLPLNQMFRRFLPILETYDHKPRQWCGVGTTGVFYDIDGSRLPCAFCTPMTLNEEQMKAITSIDFFDKSVWIDDCFTENCYLYPICPHCTGANFQCTGNIHIRDKSKCRIQKLITLYSADIQGKRLLQNFSPDKDDGTLKYTITAIEKIRKLYLPEFEQYMRDC